MISRPVYYDDVEKCVDDLIAHVGKRISMAIPLALGKPTHLTNAIYRRAKQDPSIHFTLVTAVTLEKPTWSNDLEKRFLAPLVDRVWDDFPDFEYVADLRKGVQPQNFDLVEFFFKAGAWLKNPHAQQNYLGSNYTHAVRDGRINGINVISQLLAKRETDGVKEFSMGSNPDTHELASRLFREAAEKGEKVAVIGQVNTNMPFMYGKAVVEPARFDMIIDSPKYDFKLFGAPKESVNTQDWMIGLHASTLVKDGGTLQVGIGSLGDAIVSGLEMRHRENETYREFLSEMGITEKFRELIESTGGYEPFEEGLLGSSEMFVDSLLELFKAGILKRKTYENAGLQRLLNDGVITETVTPALFDALLENKVVCYRLSRRDFEFLCHFGIFKEGLTYEDGMIHDGDDIISADMTKGGSIQEIRERCLGTILKNGVALYASFFIGPQRFYDDLNALTEEERRLIDMRGVDYVNQLYGGEEVKSLQRQHGRFINAALKVTLSGAVVADGLATQNLVSGPGGQYNFVSMAHALEDARAVTMVRSTRGSGRLAKSNVVWDYGHVTIPRHLRDIVVTEYGMADLRGRRDKDAFAALINIADSRFQADLLAKAKKAGKIPKDYQIPEQFTHNTPEHLESMVAPYRARGFFPVFPFGTDFTDEEIVIGKSLRMFKEKIAENKFAALSGLAKQLFSDVPLAADPYLERMDLAAPTGLKEKVLQKVVVYAMDAAGQI